MDVTVAIFALTYAAIALGKIPGLRVDRTGAALLGAIAMTVSGRISIQDAWASVSVVTMALLFGLMIVSSAFIVSGFYGWAASRMASLLVGPKTLLAVFIGVSALLSALLTNDVVVLAMVPLLVAVTLARGLNPVPFLLGFCFASNTGSVGTLIGSPQNMIIAQGLGLSFTAFVRAALLPSLLSLPLVWAAIAIVYRHRWELPGLAARVPPEAVVLNRIETAKAAVVTLAVVLAFVFTDWPRPLIAL